MWSQKEILGVSSGSISQEMLKVYSRFTTSDEAKTWWPRTNRTADEPSLWGRSEWPCSSIILASDGITPSGSVGSGKDSDIRDLLFGVVEPRCCDDTHGLAWASVAIDRSTRRILQIACTYSSDDGAE